MPYLINEPITGSVEVRDSGGDLADATTVVVTVTAPDATTSTPSVTNASTGVYAWTFTPSQSGRYVVYVDADGDNDCAITPQQFDVWALTQKLIISLDDVRAALNLSATDTSSNDELQLYVAGATTVIEDIIGKVLTETIVETFDGGKTAVLLSQQATSITTVVEDGDTLTSDDYTASLPAGIVYRGSSSAPQYFAAGRQNVVVTYVAGAANVPPNVVLAARTLIQHAYAMEQQAVHPAFSEPTEELAETPSGYLVPRRVMEWLSPDTAGRLPGFA